MRLLFITATRVGDAVLSTGILDHLIKTHPGIRVTVAAGRTAAPLFGAVPGLERVRLIDKRPWRRHWLKLWSAAVTTRWSVVVDLRASAIAYLLPARRRYVIGRRAAGLHRVAELGRLVGLDPPPAPRVWLAGPHEDLAAQLVPAGGPVLALGPAANWGAKQWPAERFAALTEALTAPGGILPGARVAILAAKGERPQVQPAIRALPGARVIDLVGRVELPVAAAVLQRCALFVGNDSGLMHLAAAAGTPTLGLFGPSPEWRYHPWGAHAAVVRTKESFEELTGGRDYDPRNQTNLMGSLRVEDAVSAAEDLWHRLQGGWQGA